MWKKEDEAPKSTHPQTSSLSAPSTAREPLAEGPRDRAVIGTSITVNGELSGGEDLLIQGRVDGRIDLAQHTVTIGRSGHIAADVFAKIIHVEGEVKGNLCAAEQVLLHKTASVQGNLTSPRIALEDGCKFKGSIDMDPQAVEQRGKAARPGLPPPVGERPLATLAK